MQCGIMFISHVHTSCKLKREYLCYDDTNKTRHCCRQTQLHQGDHLSRKPGNVKENLTALREILGN